MTENQWSKALTEIDVVTTINGGERRALRTAKENRRAADAFESADWTVHTARRDACRALEILIIECAGRAWRRQRFG